MSAIAQEAKKAIAAERYLQNCYRRMQRDDNNSRINNILHDLLVMEEMNEVLLRALIKQK